MMVNGGRFGPYVARKLNDHGDPLDQPKASKFEVGYVLPPEGVAIECSTCAKFRPPTACATVGNEGAIIYPQGCCDEWVAEGALPSTPEDPNPGNVPAPLGEDGEDEAE